MTTAALYFGSTNLTPTDMRWRASLLEPPMTKALYDVRGEDLVVPSLAGRIVASSGSRIADRLVINLELFVQGIPDYDTTEREDFLASWETLGAIFDPKAAPANLVVYGPLFGVISGKKRTIAARFLNLVSQGGIVGVAQKYSVQLESVASPPIWAETANP